MLFWTLLPHRDPKFMLPGLIPLAVLIGGINSRAVLAILCGFELLSAANFGFGLIPGVTIRVQNVPLTVFRSMMPAVEDWKIAKILGEMRGIPDASEEREHLSVMADHPRFNSATFEWERSRLGLGNIRIRLPGQQMGEFSNFIVIKMAPSVVAERIVVQANPFGSLSVADASQKPDQPPEEGGWFQQGYEAMQRWNLPDGDRAVMFWRRRIFSNPFHERTAFFQYYEEGPVVARNMRVDLGEWDPARGVHRSVSVRASELAFGDFKATDVHLIMEDLTLLPIEKTQEETLLTDTQNLLLNVRFLRMRRLKILAGTVMEKDAEKYLSAQTRIPGLRVTDLKLNKNVVLKASLFNIVPVSVEVAAQARSDGRGMDLEVQRSDVAGVPLPLGLLLGERIRTTLAFDLDLPFEVEVAPFNIADGRVVMSRR